MIPRKNGAVKSFKPFKKVKRRRNGSGSSPECPEQVAFYFTSGISRGTTTRQSLFSSTFLFRLTHPRKTHLYGVGTGKSGTHSLAAIFSDQLRTAHEPKRFKVIDVILAASAGRIKDEQLIRYILRRDRKLWLEVDSSPLNFFFPRQTGRAIFGCEVYSHHPQPLRVARFIYQSPTRTGTVRKMDSAARFAISP